MQSVMPVLILVCLGAILVSLGSGLFHLSRGTPEDSRKLARALTVRIGLSLVLFVLLIVAWYFGLIAPHTLDSGAPHS